MGLIDDLVASARERARRIPRLEPSSRPAPPTLADVLRGKDRLDVIAEFKKRSPSLGPIAERDLEAQVKKYEEAGAAAVSVLTEPGHFGGELSDLARAAALLAAPVLMKDFVVEPSQVREAARLGARGVLLIVRCLSPVELEELVSACSHYGLTPLIECHSWPELEAAAAFDSAVLGINNRDLDTLDVDPSLAPRLLAGVPRDRIAVAESGYQSAADVREIRGLADAVLVGSALMKHDDPGRLIREIRG